MAPRPSLLYLSPVIPALTGNGLAIRAGVVLEVLARHYTISLRVVPLYLSPSQGIPAYFASLCRDTRLLSPAPSLESKASSAIAPRSLWERVMPRLGVGTRQRTIDASLSTSEYGHEYVGPFAVIHVFRLAAVPFAHPYLIQSASSCRAPQLHLDLDDLESQTHTRLAQLLRRNNEQTRARFEDLEAIRSAAQQRAVLRQFDRVYVCSVTDRDALLGGSAHDGTLPLAQIHVLPNGVRRPKDDPVPASTASDNPFVFLFLGTLGYYPNVDAAQYFCTEIVPLIRRITTRPFRVVIVGTGVTESIGRLAGQPGVDVVGEVPEVDPWYRLSHAVVVPIRAGGGTRIKILEAFMHLRPVVSTSMGIEGIDAYHGEHALIGDTSETFAACCVEVMNNRTVAELLVKNARALVQHKYTVETLAERIASLC